jgi:seryl-tRNA synthetase
LLDIRLIRERPEVVRESLEKRRGKEGLLMLDSLIEHDKKWRDLLTKANKLRHERRLITNQVAALKKAGRPAAKDIERGRKLDGEIRSLQKNVERHRGEASRILMRLPNLLHESVPMGRDKTGNQVVKTWGDPPKLDFKPRNHLEIAKILGLIDSERGAKVAGHGFFYLRDDLVMLDLALQRFAVDLMLGKGFRPVEPPLMLRRKPYEGVTDLADFENVMYKVENEDLYMIATAEHPLAAMFMDEVLLKDDLPIKLVGVSSCFRKEVGAHGKYTKGLFRMHQFNKVEQFVFCLPEESWRLHEELQRNAEELYQKLGLHHEVVILCSGETGTVQAKTYDINLWMADGAYREAGSNSNCTDYQARRLNIRYREKDGQAPKGFVHTLNNTALATSRTMLAILEQNQERDGSVTIPKALVRYMNGREKVEPH